jgi:hypothetical protein
MDEYLLLLVAKLKADRLKLEREQRMQLHTGERPHAPAQDTPAREIRGTVPELRWRMQS